MAQHTQQDLLQRLPPGSDATISDFDSKDYRGNACVNTPDIELHCPTCKGARFFYHAGLALPLANRNPQSLYLTYLCRNCRQERKTFAVAYTYNEAEATWHAHKYGENPSFGPPTPARAITLIGPDREEFLKGRRCENQGLGVGAFVYYRRVVENQKARIFEEILRVSRHLGAPTELLDQLESAKSATQFTKAVDAIKAALPQSLLINGHNPLVLLHSALSEGVHALSDEQCLALASSVRVVLVEFAERLAQAMKDEAELNAAVAKLAQKGAA